ncbi:mannose-1-phosphate guanylyltransferase/mannose-6-phosphate isomerase [Dickeya chrysanthemi]|uniref:mannose-1-phosphate guanylyltransferase n=1 Tax=Dickeya chrysanthemi TaxID=556 RepID=A0ABU8JGH1_DICCH|nr:mannose-1-phosphate guanylyltransferase/mannose-6-phosphate isomerase [Dickeya chrysanthemi]MBX9444791.1 mannose-1-phosphate guanylyltransferase/mannose-6-phosphate isomerase [Dickeya chrysanthemi]MCA7008217.1 mannose-1-phosphate guanylyltransferase/mannose-6-phosphate isomerase [Dickeya chrysanthemi]
MSNIIPVIMAGGSGSRLWPLSRELFPKQFLPLGDEGRYSLLQNTLARLQGLPFLTTQRPLVICNEDHRFLVAEQLREQQQLGSNIILEPVGRNTAPAIALAAHLSVKTDPDSLLLVLAADHLIKKTGNFHQAIQQALPYAYENKLVTFGIVPTSPETGYGYIKTGASLSGGGFTVDEFVEKPDLATAERYLKSGDYCWNSGMFLFRAAKYLDELQKNQPDIYEMTRVAMARSQRDMDFIRVESRAFMDCPSDSIDYAVMEKTRDAVVIAFDAGWSDVGSWSSLWEVSEKDAQGNVTLGDVIALDSHNNYVSASSSSLVATIGIDDAIIVNTGDALLVAAKDRAQDVKKVVECLKAQNRHQFRDHIESFRPWGKSRNIDAGEHYQVKKLTVRPGQGLSLQQHFHRAEHWIVLSGTARVQVDDNTYFLSENQSTFIQPGAVHTLENPGLIDLVVIEVRSGRYLEEDDIVRLHDRYGRV